MKLLFNISTAVIVAFQTVYYVCRYGLDGAEKKVNEQHKEVKQRLEEAKNELKRRIDAAERDSNV